MRQSNGRFLATAVLGLAASFVPSARASEAPIPAVWRTCLQHFAPRADPRVDAMRLGVSCGPVTGLSRLAKANGVVDEAARPVVLRWKAQRRDCFRVFAVAAATVDDLEVEIVGPRGARVALGNQSRRWVVEGEEGPFCAREAGDFEARFSTHAGRGAVSAAVWRGARMWSPGSPFAEGASLGSGDGLPPAAEGAVP